jgi:hypothetical protein
LCLSGQVWTSSQVQVYCEAHGGDHSPEEQGGGWQGEA